MVLGAFRVTCWGYYWRITVYPSTQQVCAAHHGLPDRVSYASSLPAVHDYNDLQGSFASLLPKCFWCFKKVLFPQELWESLFHKIKSFNQTNYYETLFLCVSLPVYKRSLMYYYNALNWSVFVCTSCWLELRLEQQEVKLSPKNIWLQPRTWTPSGLLGQASFSFYCSVNSTLLTDTMGHHLKITSLPPWPLA